jgi:NADPH:quinone reductase-like Zn-dependent oxidoreductase
MKAIRYYRYGAPDVLELAEIDKPAAGDGELLVRAARRAPSRLFRGQSPRVRVTR